MAELLKALAAALLCSLAAMAQAGTAIHGILHLRSDRGQL